MENPLLSQAASPDPAESDSGVLDLARSLRRAAGSFSLFIATCNDPAWRDHCVRHLNTLIPGSLVRSCRPETQDPLAEIGHPQPPPACIHLTGLELAVPADESTIQPLRLLNLHRARWRELGCPVVLWVPEYLLGMLLRRAPDFADWRSAAILFQSPSGWNSTLRYGISASNESRNTNRDALHSPFANAAIRQERVFELAARLADQLPPNATAANDSIQAGWCQELAFLLVLDGSLEKARHFHALALAFWENSNDPSSLALSWGNMGNTYYRAGFLSAAESAFESARALYSRLVSSDSTNIGWQHDLSVSLEKLGELAMARGDLDAATGFFTGANEIFERLAASDSANVQWQRDFSVSLEKLGSLAVVRGDLEAAMLFFTGAKEIAERLAVSYPANARLQRDLAVLFDRFGDLAMARGDLADAVEFFTGAKEISVRLATADPENAEWQRDLSISLNRLGDLAMTQGDLAAAAGFFTGAKEINERLGAADPANVEWQRDISVSLNRLGDLAMVRGELVAAADFFTAAKDIAARLGAADPANAGWQYDLSISHFKLFQVAAKSGDEANAEAALKDGFQVLDGMKRRGMHLDPQSAQLHEELAARFAG